MTSIQFSFEPTATLDDSLHSYLIDWLLFPQKYLEFLRSLKSSLKSSKIFKLLELFFIKIDAFKTIDNVLDKQPLGRIQSSAGSTSKKKKETLRKLLLATVEEFGLTLDYLEEHFCLEKQFEILEAVKDEYTTHPISMLQFSRCIVRTLNRNVSPLQLLGVLLKTSETENESLEQGTWFSAIQMEVLDFLESFVKQQGETDSLSPVWPASSVKYRGTTMCKQIRYEMGEFYFRQDRFDKALDNFRSCVEGCTFTATERRHESRGIPFITFKKETASGYIRACLSVTSVRSVVVSKQNVEGLPVVERVEHLRRADLTNSGSLGELLEILKDDIGEHYLTFSYRENLMDSFKDRHENHEFALVQKIAILNFLKKLAYNQALNGPNLECVCSGDAHKVEPKLLHFFMQVSRNLLSTEDLRASFHLPDFRRRLGWFLELWDQHRFRMDLETAQHFEEFKQTFWPTQNQSVIHRVENMPHLSACATHVLRNPHCLLSNLYHSRELSKLELWLRMCRDYQAPLFYKTFLPNAVEPLPAEDSLISSDMWLLLSSLLHGRSSNDEVDFAVIVLSLVRAHLDWRRKRFADSYDLFHLAHQKIAALRLSEESTSLLPVFYFARLHMVTAWCLYVVKSGANFAQVLDLCETLAYECLEMRSFDASTLCSLFALYLSTPKFQLIFCWGNAIKRQSKESFSRCVYELASFLLSLKAACDRELHRSFENTVPAPDLALLEQFEYLLAVHKSPSPYKSSRSESSSKDEVEEPRQLLLMLVKRIRGKEMLELLICLFSIYLNRILDEENKLVFWRVKKGVGEVLLKFTGLKVGTGTCENFPRDYLDSHEFFLLLGDLYKSKKSFKRAFCVYYWVGLRHSDMFSLVGALPAVWDQEVVQRMVACLFSMKAYIQAAALAQFIEGDYPLKFRAVYQACAQERSELDYPYYQFFWDKQILELFMYLHKKSHDSKREELAASALSDPYNNFVNDVTLQKAHTLHLQSRLLKLLAKDTFQMAASE
ncbi:uncharacterized protein LOC135144304 isoform X3 [Zophobas morio]|uniref:uncharacterized protein LOC135144304 isoform X3 n=1 Tax=Zophobas morio TaxID=2755281 RepID=UPI00308300D3